MTYNPRRYRSTNKDLYARLVDQLEDAHKQIEKLKNTNLVLNEEIRYLQAQVEDYARRLAAGQQ